MLDNNWRIIWKSGVQLEGPAVSVGSRVIASGGSFDLGDPIFRRSAVVWYVLRSAIDRLEAEDAWFAITPEVKAIYPARGGFGTSWNGSEGRIYLHENEPDAWHPDMVLYRFMLQWHDHHTEGVRKASGFPSAFFAFGFSLFAANAMMHELWGSRLELPLNRRAVAEGLALSTLEEIEHSEPGVQNALRLLRSDQRQGWWSHLFGTALAYPDNRPDDDGDGSPDHPDEVGVKQRLDQRQVPAGPDHLSLWDILRTFRPTRRRAGTRTWTSTTRTTACSRSSIAPSTSTTSATTSASCSCSASTRWPPTSPTNASRRSEPGSEPRTATDRRYAARIASVGRMQPCRPSGVRSRRSARTSAS